MKNFRLTLEYDGTHYNGWQVQSKDQKRKGGRVKTIQGILEDALFTIFAQNIRVISSSRTDSGAHAKAHAANFKTGTEMSPIQIKKALNSLLPADIVVRKAERVRQDFNAQFDALSKRYRYVIYNNEEVSPFVRRYVCHFKQPLDIEVMKKEAKVLLGTHDFTSFKMSNEKSSNCRRTIKKLMLKKKGDFIEINVEADGFLYNMVRNIAGTLIEIGRSRFPEGSMSKILKNKDRKTAGPTAPASGLCLMSVKYKR